MSDSNDQAARLQEILEEVRPGADGGKIAVRLGASLVSVVWPVIGAAMATVSAGLDFLTAREREAQVHEVLTGLVDGYRAKDSEPRTTREEGGDAEAAAEAFRTAFRAALFGARRERSYRLGRVLGATMAEDAPNWDEATEYVRSLEELNEADILALKSLWRFQRTAFRVIHGGRRYMSTDAQDYVPSWPKFTGRVETDLGVGKDELQSRCARLTGFGLAVPVQGGLAVESTSDACYRLTSRAVRLLELLGRNVDPGAYPSIRYNESGETRRVEDEDEDLALGPEWRDSPAAFNRGEKP